MDNHLSIIRSWIQWHAVNGSSVTWGTNDIVVLNTVTVKDLENLATEIATVTEQRVIKDIAHKEHMKKVLGG